MKSRLLFPSLKSEGRFFHGAGCHSTKEHGHCQNSGGMEQGRTMMLKKKSMIGIRILVMTSMERGSRPQILTGRSSWNCWRKEHSRKAQCPYQIHRQQGRQCRNSS